MLSRQCCGVQGASCRRRLCAPGPACHHCCRWAPMDPQLGTEQHLSRCRTQTVSGVQVFCHPRCNGNNTQQTTTTSPAGGRGAAAGAPAVPGRLLRPDAAAAQLLAARRVPAGVPAPDRLRCHRYSVAVGTSCSLGAPPAATLWCCRFCREHAGVTCLQPFCLRPVRTLL